LAFIEGIERRKTGKARVVFTAKRCLHHHPHWTDGLLERPVQNGTFLVPSMITELASKK
jgi:hypothetical protein